MCIGWIQFQQPNFLPQLNLSPNQCFWSIVWPSIPTHQAFIPCSPKLMRPYNWQFDVHSVALQSDLSTRAFNPHPTLHLPSPKLISSNLQSNLSTPPNPSSQTKLIRSNSCWQTSQGKLCSVHILSSYFTSIMLIHTLSQSFQPHP